MSMMEELNFFLGLQIKQEKEGIFINQTKYISRKYLKINLSKNSVLHSRTKHIDVRHYFIKDQVLNGTVFFDYVCIENQIADIFTKPLNEERFCDFQRELGIFDPSS